MLRLSMGSQFKGVSKDLDEYTRQIKYTHSRDIRREIGAIRQSINVRRAACCTKFFGAYFTNDVGKNQLIEICQKADREMKEIDSSLHVTPMFMKIDLPDLASGSQFDALLTAIRSQIMDVVLRRIQSYLDRDESGSLNPKQKTLLSKMIDNVKGLNIVNDPKINADLEAMRARIMASQIKELRAEILSAMDETKDRGSSIELIPDTPIPSEEEEEDQITRSASLLPNTARDLDLV